jgi:protein-S-isoprenylcysteine O-methyltransferase Ste14
MARILYPLFALAAYALFFATFLYLIAFVGNLPWVPVTVDRGGQAGPVALAVVVDLALIALFGLQHSVMARPGFKNAWTRIVPKPLERSVYVVAASLVLVLLFAMWRPIPAVLWSVDNAGGAAVLWTLFGLGWLIVLVSTFLISHFELFGLAQAWGHAKGAAEAAPPVLRTPLFYRHVRHPLYSGFFLAFWATPQMSAGHLLLAVGMSIYILIGIAHEERDLISIFGDDYRAYRARTGMLAPRFGRKSGTISAGLPRQSPPPG